MIEKIKEWAAANKALALALAGIAGLFIIRKMVKPKRRRRRVRPVRYVRGVSRNKVGRKVASLKRVYTKGGKAKKPWQIKGSLAAKRHMARLRKMK